MPKEYSEDFKCRVINRYENGEPILTLSQELGVSQSTIYHWRREYCAVQTPDQVFTPKEISSLVQHVKKLEETLEVIRASGFISAVPLGDRLAFLEKLYRSESTYSVHTICEPWMWQGGPSITTSSAAPTEQRSWRRKQSLCC